EGPAVPPFSELRLYLIAYLPERECWRAIARVSEISDSAWLLPPEALPPAHSHTFELRRPAGAFCPSRSGELVPSSYRRSGIARSGLGRSKLQYTTPAALLRGEHDRAKVPFRLACGLEPGE